MDHLNILPPMTQILHSNLLELDIYNHIAEAQPKNLNFKHNTEKTNKNPVTI